MSLAALSSEDRHWLLGQLTEDDRTRILSSLWEVSAAPDLGEVDAHNGASIVDRTRLGINTDSHPMDRDDHLVVDKADVHVVQSLLQQEPDWLVAVLLTHAEWSWTDAFMETRSPEQLGRITAAMKVEAAAVKPRVRQVILANVAHKLRQLPQTRPISPSFERILSRAEERMSQTIIQGGESA